MYVISILWLTGCTHIGPQTVPRDRFDYNTAISDSWKEQTLLNIVKLRYADMPLFVEVASVVSGYTLEGSVNLGGTVSSEGAVQGDFLSMGTAGKYTDRPTITYAPITGSKFNESFMTPIPPKAILFLLQSGWPADMIFPIAVDSINGLRSRVAAGASQRPGDPDFYRRGCLAAEDTAKRCSRHARHKGSGSEANDGPVFSPHEYRARNRGMDQGNKAPSRIGSEAAGNHCYLRSHPGEQSGNGHAHALDPADYGRSGHADRRACRARGRWSHRSLSGTTRGHEEKIWQRIRVQSSPDKPEFAFTTVKYENHWFWIDKRDFLSKRTFAFLMILFSLTETGSKGDLPLVTIPAG